MRIKQVNSTSSLVCSWYSKVFLACRRCNMLKLELLSSIGKQKRKPLSKQLQKAKLTGISVAIREQPKKLEGVSCRLNLRTVLLAKPSFLPFACLNKPLYLSSVASNTGSIINMIMLLSTTPLLQHNLIGGSLLFDHFSCIFLGPFNLWFVSTMQWIWSDPILFWNTQACLCTDTKNFLALKF